ncbi:hypothetical protein GCM10027090_40340 [Sinomonas soli]
MDRIAARSPLYLVLDADPARNLGRILPEELCGRVDLVVPDGVSLHDYVDLGRPRARGHSASDHQVTLVLGADLS